ncbi:MAG: sodium:proton antiporter [Pseudomonadota bacterium]
MHDIAPKIALIGILGILAQWIAWRFRLPAIVLLSAAGILAGPVFGLLDPREDFGDLLKPMIGLAVAIILFEGGLTLNFAEIRETSKAVRRLVFLGSPIAWVLGSLAAHYVAGFGWPAAIILSGIFVVTGPTVIMPLLRMAKLSKRPAALLRWEAILADPVGALFAVLAFEIYLVFGISDGHHDLQTVIVRFLIAMPMGAVGGWYLGKAIAFLFIRGLVPEFLKAPIILVAVLAAYVATNLVLEEAGLLTVTAMGVAMANTRIASLSEMRRFKEVITIVLVSGLFVILTATLEADMLSQINGYDLLYIVLLLCVVRPVAVFLATMGTGLSAKERSLIAWIAPRGIVAVAVSGLFGTTLVEVGNPDGDKMVAIAFAVVFITVVLHGFSLRPLAIALGLSSSEKAGLLIVGGNRFSVALARELNDADVPVTVVDNNFNHLREARLAGLTTHFGEVLSEEREHRLDLHAFSHALAASDNDAYNLLVCNELAHELGRSNTLQLKSQADDMADHKTPSFTVGGRRLFTDPLLLDDLMARMGDGYTFQTTKISEAFTFEDYLAQRGEGVAIICVVDSKGALTFATGKQRPRAEADDRVVAFALDSKLTGDQMEIDSQ